VVEGEYTFAFASNAPLEPGTAIADVKKDKAEIWSSLKVPITAQGEIAEKLGMPQSAVTVHVLTGGGSFGRRLFHDAATDAALASQAFGKPVKVMWHRTDECRQGRCHPMSVSKLRANVLGGEVVSFEQHHASVRTDYSHGFGELVTSTVTRAPLAGLSVSEIIFETTAMVPYSFGPSKQLLTETHQGPGDNQDRGSFNTTSMRNVYSPNVVTAHELFVDKIAEQLGKDPYEFRHAYVKDEHFKKVLETVAKAGEWGKKLPPGMAQGIGLHREYKQTLACLV
jgi:isoquinoline 1-oxidoreductase beta subunit